MAKRSGGGISMNKNVKVPVRGGPPRTNVVLPGGADALGASYGDHVTEKGVKGRIAAQPLIKRTAPEVPMGNAVALNVGKGGPGTGRSTLKCGSQGTYGPVNQGSAP